MASEHSDNLLISSEISASVHTFESDAEEKGLTQCSCYCPSLGSPPWECGLSTDKLDKINKDMMEGIIQRREAVTHPLPVKDVLCFEGDDDIDAIRRKIKKRNMEKKEDEAKMDLLMEQMLTLQYELKKKTLSRR